MVTHLFDFVWRGRWIHRRSRRSGRRTSPSRCRTSIPEPRSAVPPCASSPPGRARTTLSKYVMVDLDSSFSVIHKVGNVDIFVLLKFGNKMDTEISHFNYNSKYYDKCKSASKLIRLLSDDNLFWLVVQKCQHCQLCILWENFTEQKKSVAKTECKIANYRYKIT